MEPVPTRQRGRGAAAPRSLRAGLRLIQYLGVLAVIGGALVVIVPYVSSQSVAPETVLADKPPKVSKADKRKKEEADLWLGKFLDVKITFDGEEWENLHRDERRYAKASLEEGGRTYPEVAIKLKGSAGSFQGRDGKPGLTINFDYFKGATRYHGLKKIHFNNGAQDGTYLQEQIAGEMARKAGVPASRCTHANVTVQDKNRGLYVVKEAFTEEFLQNFYKNPKGDLYDGGFVREIDENMEKDQGDPKDRKALKELIGAANEGDLAKRWERLGQILDLDMFASYCAMEAILCHWDGYSFNRNNYRLYRDLDSGKFSFFLHGMDQTFGDMNFPLNRDFGGLVSNAFMRCPEGAKLYQAKLAHIYTEILKPIDWGARVNEVGEQVRAALEKIDPRAAKDYVPRIAEARTRITQRIAGIGRQLGDAPQPFNFDAQGISKLDKDWRAEGGAAESEERAWEGKPCFYIHANNDSPGSWRHTINLPPGKYRFEGRLRTKDAAPGESPSGEGAGLRISGRSRKGINGLTGNGDWQVVAYPFEATGGEVVLVAELSGKSGEAWIEKNSLQIVRVP